MLRLGYALHAHRIWKIRTTNKFVLSMCTKYSTGSYSVRTEQFLSAILYYNYI